MTVKDADLLVETGLFDRPVVPNVVKKKGRPKGSKDSYPRKRAVKTARSDPIYSTVVKTYV